MPSQAEIREQVTQQIVTTVSGSPADGPPCRAAIAQETPP
jgi:hypothetical protein